MSRLNVILLVLAVALAGLCTYLFLSPSRLTADQSVALLDSILEKGIVPLITMVATLAGVWLQSARQSDIAREEREQQRQWDVQDRLFQMQSEYYAARTRDVEQLATDVIRVTERMNALKFEQYFGTDVDELIARLREDVQAGIGSLIHSLAPCLAFSELLENAELSTALQELRKGMNEVPQILDKSNKGEINTTGLLDEMLAVGVRLWHTAQRVLVANERLRDQRYRLVLNSTRKADQPGKN